MLRWKWSEVAQGTATEICFAHVLGISTALMAAVLCSPVPAAAQNANDPGKGTLYRSVPPPDPNVPDRSHSHLGAAFDQGPRQAAHLWPGVGNVHFPVTTGSAMAQRFFDQGINLLYCFSWYEAERSFRQSALLDPNCAMAYWGMAMCDNARGNEFLQLAHKHEADVTDRERRYIAALAINFRGGDEKSRVADNIKALEQLTYAYPKDIEAKAMLAWELYRQQQHGDITYRSAIDALLKEVLAKNPLHPGANHFRIHMWDGVGAENALDSCRAFTKASPAIGHALHMPGHIYARLGMWDAATYAMDASARAERRYFFSEHQMPYDSWDYGHDQDFLISSLGYNGHLKEGAGLSWELIDIPHDPQYNNGSGGSTAGQGRFGLMRMRVRGEKWDEIIGGDDPGWSNETDDKAWKVYQTGLAYLGKGDKDRASKSIAELDTLKAGGDGGECARLELHGRFDVLFGKAGEGLKSLKQAAEIELAKFKYGDPIGYPRPLYETLAWAQIHEKLWDDAKATLKEGLERNPNNGFALCLKIECLLGAGDHAGALSACRQLQTAWRHADPDIPALQRIEHLGIATNAGIDLKPQRYLSRPELIKVGPDRWQPFPCGDLEALNQEGKPVKLSDYRGHNVVLVFTLGGSCPHCNRQLEAFSKEASAFRALNTDIVSVSSDTPASIKAYQAGNPQPVIDVLSDPKGKAARVCKAYDDFEKLDLHATLLIDRNGRVWWYRTSTEPFFDLAFLKQEIVRMDSWDKTLVRRGGSDPGDTLAIIGLPITLSGAETVK